MNNVLGDYIPSFNYLVIPLNQYSKQDLIEKNDELSLIFLINQLQSSSEFHDLKDIPSVQASGNIRSVLKDLQGRYQDIVIDAGGQDSEALRSAMTIATHMLLPFRPKRRDLKTLAHMEQVLKLAKTVNPDLIARAIITQCPTLPSQVQRILDAKEDRKSVV